MITIDKALKIISVGMLLIVMPARLIGKWCDFWPTCSAMITGIVDLLLVAGACYAVSSIAIGMLFKPCHPCWLHPYSLLTLFTYKQGYFPKNQERIASRIGQDVAYSVMLEREKIADNLCGLMPQLIKKTGVTEDLRTLISAVLQKKRKSAVDTVTYGMMQMASSPIVALLKRVLFDEICEYAGDQQILRRFSVEFSESVISSLDWKEIEHQISGVFQNTNIEQIISRLSTDLENECNEFVENQIMPRFHQVLMNVAKKDLDSKIVEKLNLYSRIITAARDNAPERFSQSILDLAPNHLSAIRVICWCIGAIVGSQNYFLVVAFWSHIW